MAAAGSWLAYHEDRSELALFSSEIAAYRHANGTSMVVKLWPFGKTLSEITEPQSAISATLDGTLYIPAAVEKGKAREARLGKRGSEQ